MIHRDADSMAKDPGLVSLHGDPAFEALVAAARTNASTRADAAPR